MSKYFTLFKQAFTEFNRDKVPRLGAALAYYTIFSLAPLLLIIIAISGIVFGHDAAQNKIFEQLRGVLGSSTAIAVQEIVKAAAKPKSGTVATVIGIATLILGASGVFGQLKDALNTIWDVEPKEDHGIMTLLKDYLLSFAMVLGIGLLLLVSLLMGTVITAMGSYARGYLPGGETLWHAAELAFSFCVITVLMGMIFRFLPELKIEWGDVWMGASLTSLLFTLGRFALGIYFARSAVASIFGAAGSLVIVLLWVYYSAQILLFGAEFTQVYARSHGSRQQESKAKKSPSPAEVPVTNDKAAPIPGGGRGKLIGVGAGLLIGALIGVVSTTIVVMKSVKRLFTP